jgi:hypothetical protein
LGAIAFRFTRSLERAAVLKWLQMACHFYTSTNFTRERQRARGAECARRIAFKLLAGREKPSKQGSAFTQARAEALVQSGVLNVTRRVQGEFWRWFRSSKVVEEGQRWAQRCPLARERASKGGKATRERAERQIKSTAMKRASPSEHFAGTALMRRHLSHNSVESFENLSQSSEMPSRTIKRLTSSSALAIAFSSSDPLPDDTR